MKRGREVMGRAGECFLSGRVVEKRERDGEKRNKVGVLKRRVEGYLAKGGE